MFTFAAAAYNPGAAAYPDAGYCLNRAVKLCAADALGPRKPLDAKEIES
jgi:hypothetical protein